MLQGAPNSWSTQPTPSGGPESILSSYCRELERLSATLADLIEVSGGRRDAMSANDTDAFRSLYPKLERLEILVARVIGAPPAAEPMRLAQPAIDPEPATPARPSFMRSLASEMDAMAKRPATAGPGAGVVPPTAPVRSTPPTARPSRNISEDARDEADEFMQWVRRELVENAEAAPTGAATQQKRAPVPLDELLPTLLRDVAFGVSIQGTTESMPMKAVFQLIDIGRKSGCLHVRTPTEHARFVFDSGRVVAATTNEPREGSRLGDFLVALGFLDVARLDSVLDRIQSLGVPLGEALLRDKLVTQQQLEKALVSQLLDHFERFEREPLVAYAFVPHARSSHDGKLRMSPRELLLEAARRADEHQQRKD